MNFVQGLVIALSTGELWNSQRNPSNVYFGRTRVHHYEAGVVLFFLGALLRSPALSGFGAGLFLHDIDDVSI